MLSQHHVQIPFYGVFEVLERLVVAKKRAVELGIDHWEFAIEISDFLERGFTRHALRELVSYGLVTHKREIALPNLKYREFQNEAVHCFTDRTCFVITKLGQQQVQKMVQASNPHYVDSNGCPVDERRPLKPNWIRKNRQLTLGKSLVKEFKYPAHIQFTVLDRFEQLGWPPRIINPLPKDDNICPKKRLHDAIKCLNKRKENDLVQFRGDGTGHGVLAIVAAENTR